MSAPAAEPPADPDHELLRRLFDEAVELPVAARAAFVDAQCAAHPRLCVELRTLIAAAEDEQFLRFPTLATGSGPASAAASAGEGPGTRLGPYLLLELLGEGGFGAVFLAEQQQPVARRVALKIVKLGMDTRQVVARFEQERQALAVLDHPNIARVLDAGATATGRPYFVMDLVQGIPITDYCDQHRLAIDDRLALFVQVCQAVQHAHQKGIVHRDLKPGNILVVAQDGRPVAKVIDFGIAKVTARKLTEQSFLTEQLQVIGTLPYMSPEQAAGSADIDTRSDIYSLGVLLYELLTGSVPFAAEVLREAVFAEIQRLIREVAPPRPSTRVGASTTTIAAIAARRSIAPRRLGSLLRRDLDWVVMKALEKDRVRRYATAHDFAQDIQRHLTGAPVVAAPPTAVYQLRKFVQRNRGLVAASLAIAISLVGGLAAFAWQASVASERADQLALVAGFQEQMLGQLDATDAGIRLMSDLRRSHTVALENSAVEPPARSGRSEAFAQELSRVSGTDAAAAIVDAMFLAPAATAVASRFGDQPLVAATLRQTLANGYRKLGRYDQAEQLQRLALDALDAGLGSQHADTLRACHDLAAVLDQLGRYAEAEPFHRRALTGRRQLLGAEHADSLLSQASLGGNLRYQGRLAEAEPLLEAALAGTRRIRGAEHRETLCLLNAVGYLRIDQGRQAEAEPFWREAYTTGERVFGADDPDTIVWTNNLGGLLDGLGRHTDAESCYRAAFAAAQRVHGLDHPATANLQQNVANCLQLQKRHAEAERLARRALEVRARVLGDDHPDTLHSMSGLGAALRDLGKLGEAEPYLRTAWTSSSRRLGKEHPQTLRAGTSLAVLLQNGGQSVAAEALYRELLETSLPVWGERHDERLLLQQSLGNLLLQLRRLDEAEELLGATLARQREVTGDEHPDTLLAQITLASVHAAQERFDAAAAGYRDATPKFRRALGSGHPNTLSCISNLGQILLKQQQFAEAEPLLREAADGFDQVHGERHNRAVIARSCLGRALIGLQRFADAEPELLAAERALNSTEGVSPQRLQSYAELLVTLYRAWHAADPSASHDLAAAAWQKKVDDLGPAAGR